MAVREIQLFTPPPDDGGGAAVASNPELRQMLARLLARDRDNEVIRHPLQGVANLTDTFMKGLAYQQAKAREEGLMRDAADLLFGGQQNAPSVAGPTGPTPPPSSFEEPPAPPPPAPPNVDDQPIPPNDFGDEPLAPPPPANPYPPMPPQSGDMGQALGMGALDAMTPPPAPAPMPGAASPAPGPSGVPMPGVGGGMPAPPPIDMSPSPPPQVNTEAADRVPQFAPPVPLGGPQVSLPGWARQGPQGGREQIAAALANAPPPQQMMPPAGPSTMAGFGEDMPLRVPMGTASPAAPELTAAAGVPPEVAPSLPASQAAAVPPQMMSPSRDDIAQALSLAQPQQLAALGPMESLQATEPGSIVGPDLQMPTSAPQIPREAIAQALQGPLPDFRGRGGPASIRYNNPGAQYPGPSARRFGAVGTEIIGGGHKIAVFPDAVSGAAAQFDLFANRYTGIPLRSAIKKWSGGNSPGTYLKVIERETGLKPNTVLTREHLQDPKIAVPLAKAMSVQEAGRPYPMSDAAWQAAHAKAFGGNRAASAPPQEMPREAYDLPQAPTETQVAGDYTPEQLRKMYMNPYTRPLALEAWKQQNKAKQPEDFGKSGTIVQDKDGNFYSIQFGDRGQRRIEKLDIGGQGLAPAKGTETVGDTLIDKSTGREVRNVGDAIARGEDAKTSGRELGQFRAAMPKVETGYRMFDDKSQRLLNTIDRAIGRIGITTTGVGGALLKNLPNTEARALEGDLNTIRANVGFEELQNMRDASPTGGALGQVSEMENRLLQSVRAAIDQLQSGGDLKNNLGIIRDSVTKLRQIKAEQMASDRARAGFGWQPQQPAPPQSGAPQGGGWGIRRLD